jgi:pantoate--beta-alanine ligase
MVEELNMGTDIKVLPTVREKDGVAMSSRNAYLSGAERKDAAVLYEALKDAGELIAAGERSSAKIIKIMESAVRSKPTARIEYISVVDTKSLRPIRIVSGTALIAAAVCFGKTRLIDNIIVGADEALSARQSK